MKNQWKSTEIHENSTILFWYWICCGWYAWYAFRCCCGDQFQWKSVKINEKAMRPPEALSGSFLEPSWALSGSVLEASWALSGSFLERAQSSNPYTDLHSNIWKPSGKRLGASWKLLGASWEEASWELPANLLGASFLGVSRGPFRTSSGWP